VKILPYTTIGIERNNLTEYQSAVDVKRVGDIHTIIRPPNRNPLILH